VTGSNINGSLGIGTEDSQKSGENVFKLKQFNNRKVHEIAVGDFHTLVVASGCNCVDPVNDVCQGREACNGGSNLYAWGFNIHGQCSGMPTEQSILIP
jgi:alpha-tubulin suppressor-like RCC1 family protein